MSDAEDSRTIVLCVEGEGDVSLSAQCLAGRDYVLARTSNFAIARGRVRHDIFDALLIDAGSEPEAALEVAQSARRRDPHVPILAYGADLDEGWTVAAAKSGITQILDTARLSRGEIAHVVARCIADAEIANLSALSAELIAMHESVEAPGRPVPASEAWALQTFIAAGGTRAGFRRSWAAIESERIGKRTLH